MGCGAEMGFLDDASNRRVRALTRRAARTVGDRDKLGAERRQSLDRGPQRLFHLLGLGREEFERHFDFTRAEEAALLFNWCWVHGRVHSSSRFSCFMIFGAGRARAFGQPQRYRQLRPAAGVAGLHLFALQRLEARFGEPFTHMVIGKAEPLVRMTLAQLLHLVGREVDDDETAAGAQHACGLADRMGRARRDSEAPDA